jgi:P-type Ca2+ transporter type 2C
MLRNWLFMTVSSIMIGAQIVIIFVGGQAFSVVPLTGPQWAISMVLGVLSLPIGALIRFTPDAPFERVNGIIRNLWTSLIRRLQWSMNSF